MCGMRKRVLLVFKSPCGCASAVCKEAVDEQKTESHQLWEKRFVIFFFWDHIKSREQRGLQFFLCCSIYPAIHSSWKTKPLHDPPWSRPPPDSGGGLAKNWKPVFSSFFAFSLLIFKVILERSHRLLHPISLAAQQGKNGGWRAAFWLFTWDLWRQPTFVWWCQTDAVTSARSNLPVSYPLTALTFFNGICFVFFSTAKKIKKRTRRKKNHKKTWKNTTQKQFCLALHNVYKTSTHTLSTDTHTRLTLQFLCSRLLLR